MLTKKTNSVFFLSNNNNLNIRENKSHLRLRLRTLKGKILNKIILFNSLKRLLAYFKVTICTKMAMLDLQRYFLKCCLIKHELHEKLSELNI